jgi:universal stress protein E
VRQPRVQRILVAIKTLRVAPNPAVAKAAQLARAYDARVELFHSLDAPLYLDPHAVVGKSGQTLQQELQQQALARLDAIAQPLRRRGVKVAVAAVWDSPSFEAIIRRALQTRADLIIASYHAGHRRRWPLRLTDWELVRLSPVPVLLIKTPHAYRRPVILAAVDPTHAFSKPLRLDERILDTASGLSAALHGKLHAVHAFPAVPVEILAPGPRAEIVTPQRLQQAQQRAARDAQVHLDRLLRTRRIAGPRRHLIAAHPIDAIAVAADQVGSGIVVMGAISRSGLKRLLIGNTAERILDTLRCDVVIVKPARFRSPVRRASARRQLLSVAAAR